MATELKLNTNKDDKDKQDLLTNAEGSGSIGGSQPGAQPQRQATPSGRPNVQQYLNANQGAGQQLASGIQGGFQKQANQVNKGVSNTTNLLNTQSDPLSQKLGQAGSEQIHTAFKDPSSILSQQDQLDEFRRLQNQGYQSNINNLQQDIGAQQQNIATQNSQLADKAAMANNESGRFQLLQSTFGQPNYSHGQQKLDQLFLQAQPGVNRNLQQGLQGIQQGTTQNLNALNNTANNRFQSLNSLVGDRAAEAQNLFDNGIDSNALESDLNARGISDITSNAQDLFAKAQATAASNPELKARLANNTLTSADISALGLQKGTSLYNTDLSKYFSTNGDPTMAGVETPEEVARYRALQQIKGNGAADIFGGEQNIGGYNAFGYDNAGLNNEINRNKQHYEHELLLNSLPGDSAYLHSQRAMDSNTLNGNERQWRKYQGELADMLDANPNLTPDDVMALQKKYENNPVQAPASQAFFNYWNDLQNQRNRTIQPTDTDLENGNGFSVS